MSSPIITAKDCLATVPEYQLGARSESDFVQAVQLVQSHRVPVFQSHGNAVTNMELDYATCDFATMLKWQTRYSDLNLGWRVRCYRPGDNVRALYFANPKERAWALRDFGCDFSRSLEITREGNKSGSPTYWIFLEETSEPQWDFNAKMRGNETHLCKSFPLPGSIHRGTKQRWEWAKFSAPGEAVLQWLPERARYALPMIGGSLSAHLTKRPAQPKTSLWHGNEREWSDLPRSQRE